MQPSDCEPTFKYFKKLNSDRDNTCYDSSVSPLLSSLKEKMTIEAEVNLFNKTLAIK